MANNDLISILNELAHYYSLLGETYREKAYRVAAINIKNYLNVTITRENIESNVKGKIPGVGAGIYKKILEFAQTGKINELFTLRKSKIIKAYLVLSKIIGIGPQTIKKFINLNIYSLNDLKRAVKQNKVILTDVQKIGLKYYKDINTKIPRDEVTHIAWMIREIIIGINPNSLVEVVGSYRRLKPESGDIDMLVTDPRGLDERKMKQIMTKFISLVSSNKGFVSFLSHGEQKTTFLLRSDISGIVRQIDVFLLPPDELIPYLLYATGSAEHNEYIRGLAKKKGYRLNQTGLYKIINGKLERVYLSSEKQLYEVLGIDYVPPDKR